MAATETKARPAEQRGPPALAMEMDATQAAHRSRERCKDACAIVLFLPVVFIGLGTLVWSIWAVSTYKEPEYSVAIAAVSGLYPAPDRPVLDPEFNLTVRIAVRSPLLRPCDLPLATVQVNYHGFALASALAPQICEIGDEAKEGRTVTRTVVARGTRVWLPRPVLDNLTADVRRAAGVFDVTLTIPGHMKIIDDDGLVVSCLGRPIGDDGGSALCDLSSLQLRRAG